MKRLIRVLLLAAIAVMVLPAAGAFADTGPKGFTSGFLLTQTSPGTMAYVPGGISLTGENFIGTIQGCSGKHCRLLEGASLIVTQNATLYYTAISLTGDISFAGPVNGTFTISKKIGRSVESISGTYSGIVTADMTPIPGYPAYFIQGSNNSNWTVDASSATPEFRTLKKAVGSIAAAIGGYFPGGEAISGTISGTPKDD